jgi:hypothetical protein
VIFAPKKRLLLEFASEPESLYRIQYSEDGTNWQESLVRPRVGGTKVQWIDRGSPKTPSPPGPEGRFYRVIKETYGNN